MPLVSLHYIQVSELSICFYQRFISGDLCKNQKTVCLKTLKMCFFNQLLATNDEIPRPLPELLSPVCSRWGSGGQRSWWWWWRIKPKGFTLEQLHMVLLSCCWTARLNHLLGFLKHHQRCETQVFCDLSVVHVAMIYEVLLNRSSWL